MKKVGLDKAAFVKTAGELLPVLCRAWDDQWARIESVLALVATGDGGSIGAGHEATGAVALAIVCVKVVVETKGGHSVTRYRHLKI